MQIKIPSPKHYETYYGASRFVRSYLDRVEKRVGGHCVQKLWTPCASPC